MKSGHKLDKSLSRAKTLPSLGEAEGDDDGHDSVVIDIENLDDSAPPPDLAILTSKNKDRRAKFASGEAQSQTIIVEKGIASADAQLYGGMTDKSQPL